MPYLEHDNFMELMRRLSESLPSEEAVNTVRDLTDTYTENETRMNEATQKIAATEKFWKDKYFDTFFSDKKETQGNEDPEGKPRKRTFESLFKEEK